LVERRHEHSQHDRQEDEIASLRGLNSVLPDSACGMAAVCTVMPTFPSGNPALPGNDAGPRRAEA
jgi:hypothetical protein